MRKQIRWWLASFVSVSLALQFLAPALAQVGDPHTLSQPESPVEWGPLGRPVKPYPTPTPSADASSTPEPTPLPTHGHQTTVDFDLGPLFYTVTGNASRADTYRDNTNLHWLQDFDLRSRDWATPWFLNLQAFDPGYTDESLGLTTGSSGQWRLNLSYDALPRVYSTTAETIFSNTAPNVFTLSNGARSQLIAAGANPFSVAPVVDSLLTPTSLGYQRNTFDGGASVDLTPELAMGVGYSQIQRHGTQPLDTTFFFINENELAAPVSDATSRTEFAASYGHRGNDLSFDGWSDTYVNNIGFISWDNPFQLTDSNLFGPAKGLMSTAPSNQANEVSFSGGTNLGVVRLTGFASQGTWSQNAPFLPQTSNLALGATPNPLNIGNSLPGNDQRFMQNVNATARLAKNVSIKGWYRHYELDNSTPNFTAGAGQLTISDTLLFNQSWSRVAYGFARTDVGADLSWHALPSLNTVFSYKHDTTTRTNRDVAETDTSVVSVAADWHPRPTFVLDARAENGATTTGPYTPFGDEPVGLIDSDEAANNFQTVHAEVRWDPNDRLELDGEYNSHVVSYPDTFYGLQGQSDADLSFGTSYAVSPTFSAWLQASSEAYDTAQASQFRTLSFGVPTNSPLDDWFSAGSENDDVVEFGFTWKFKHRWLLDVDYLMTAGTGSVNASGVAGGNPLGDPTAWPNVTYNLNVLKLELSRKLNPDTRLKFFYRLEDYRQSDFATDVVVPYMGFVDPSAAQSVFLGATEGNYTASILGMQISRRY